MDGLALVARKAAVALESTENYLRMTPSSHVLTIIGDTCLRAFLPRVWEEHVAAAQRVDGARMRLDAVFNLAQRLVQKLTTSNEKMAEPGPYQ